MIGRLLDAVYAALLLVWAPCLLWEWLRTGKRRGGWRERILGPDLPATENRNAANLRRQGASGTVGSEPAVDSERSAAPYLWCHAVSVGEVNLLVALVPKLRQEFPGYRFAISSTTDSGLALAEKRFPADLVFRFPLDFTWAVHHILRRLRPKLLILTELEIWPNLIQAAHSQEVGVVVVNGRLSQRSFDRYRWGAWWLRGFWASLGHVLAQTAEYRDRFVALGVPAERVSVVGSIKFDSARNDRQAPAVQGLRQWAGLSDQDLVWLAGSTSAPEEEHVLAVYRQLLPDYPRLRLILVPRHAERFEEVGRQCQATGLRVWRRSTHGSANASSEPVVTSQHHEPNGPGQPNLPGQESGSSQALAAACGPGPPRSWDILLVDTIGELSDWWGVADLGFVGGSMGARGGQSMIEPAGFGVALSFGPNTRNFRDVVDQLLEVEAAVVVQDRESMRDFVVRCCRDTEYRQGLGSRAAGVAAQQRGALDRTVQALAPLLNSLETVPDHSV